MVETHTLIKGRNFSLYTQPWTLACGFNFWRVGCFWMLTLNKIKRLSFQYNKEPYKNGYEKDFIINLIVFHTVISIVE